MLISHFEHFFNFCVYKQSYPDELKISNVKPVYKKNSKEKIENHRPVSVLSNLGKIFENLMYDRLRSFFTRYSLLSNRQYGFRKNRNTEHEIMELVNKALPAIENKKYSLCIFLDCKACFDTICRSSLLKKLYRYSVRGPSFELIKSYFENRKQLVVFKSDRSDVLSQNLGVVQCSKCGPLLFDIYFVNLVLYVVKTSTSCMPTMHV